MDDRLRALERAARADPSDGAAAWTLIHALEQASSHQAAWQERCRLARGGGDLRAWLELERPTKSGVREIGGVVTRRILSGSARLVGASGRSVVIEGGNGVSGLDPATLTPMWWCPGQHGWLASGSMVFGAGQELLVLSAWSGEQLYRGALPAPATDHTWRAREQTADRLMLVCRREGPLIVVDTGENLGRLVAHHVDASVGMSTRAAHGLGFRNRRQRGEVEAFDLESNTLRWGCGGSLLDVDTQSALVRAHPPVSGVRLLDVTTGVMSAESFTEARMGYLAEDVVVLLNDVLHFALERTTGAVRWTIPRPSDPIWLEITSDVLYMVQVGSGYQGTSGGPLVLRAIDLADGSTRWEHPLNGGARSVGMAATDGAVIVLNGDELVRIARE